MDVIKTGILIFFFIILRVNGYCPDSFNNNKTEINHYLKIPVFEKFNLVVRMDPEYEKELDGIEMKNKFAFTIYNNSQEEVFYQNGSFLNISIDLHKYCNFPNITSIENDSDICNYATNDSIFYFEKDERNSCYLTIESFLFGEMINFEQTTTVITLQFNQYFSNKNPTFNLILKKHEYAFRLDSSNNSSLKTLEKNNTIQNLDLEFNVREYKIESNLIKIKSIVFSSIGSIIFIHIIIFLGVFFIIRKNLQDDKKYVRLEDV